MKKTKIICTIGPASEDPKILSEMIRHGMNVARLNFSHGSYASHKKLINAIRKTAKKLGATIAIMQDLQGPKIRVMEMKKPLEIRAGQEVVIGRDFKVDYNISNSVKPGDRILIEDGLIELQALKKSGKNIVCRARNGGLIQSHKGINIPDSKIKFPIITKKDIADLKFGLKNDVDFVATSFVRSKQDIISIKKLIRKFNPKSHEFPEVIAKIEKAEGVKNFDAILQEADAIMVARGDLGVEISEKEVPILQKNIIQKCLKNGKPVIVATQMLDSMIRNPRPTRAEVSDVANAVIDQTDCVMLSGESAFGKYPVNAVSEMNKIILTMERSPYSKKYLITPERKVSSADALAESVHDLAKRIGAKAIVSTADTPFPANEISHYRPGAHIIIFASKPKVLRQLSLLWGVHQIHRNKFHKLEELFSEANATVKKIGLAEKGDKIIVVAADKQANNLNLIEIKTVN